MTRKPVVFKTEKPVIGHDESFDSIGWCWNDSHSILFSYSKIWDVFPGVFPPNLIQKLSRWTGHSVVFAHILPIIWQVSGLFPRESFWFPLRTCSTVLCSSHSTLPLFQCVGVDNNSLSRLRASKFSLSSAMLRSSGYRTSRSIRCMINSERICFIRDQSQKKIQIWEIWKFQLLILHSEYLQIQQNQIRKIGNWPT
jgi:hypothetical protein